MAASLCQTDNIPPPRAKAAQDDATTYTFSGKRVKRGLYRAPGGRKINADINGSGNIIRKVAPDAFGRRAVEDGKAVLASLVVHPVWLSVLMAQPGALTEMVAVQSRKASI